MFKDIIPVKNNVFIIARERGKKVPGLCREGHNTWVNLGRQFLPEVMSPLNSSFNAHYNDSPIQVVRYMALGIGGDAQLADLPSDFPTLNTDHPGQNIYDDASLDTQYLERPLRVTGTPGGTGTSGVWMSDVAAPPTFGTSKVTYVTLFGTSDLHLSGAYPSVPLSEIGLLLSSQTASLTWDQLYDPTNPPSYIKVASRPRLVAYNTFDTLSKTAAVSLEIHWEIEL